MTTPSGKLNYVPLTYCVSRSHELRSIRYNSQGGGVFNVAPSLFETLIDTPSVTIVCPANHFSDRSSNALGISQHLIFRYTYLDRDLVWLASTKEL